MPVRFRDPSTRAQHLAVYVTYDAGDTWTPRPAPSVDLRALTWGFPGGIPFSASSPDHTSDAGRSWGVIHPRSAPALPRVTDVVFTSPTNGWAIFDVPQGAALVHTTNGGRDWTPLVPPRPKLRRG